MSEFGTGFVYNLGLFLCHDERQHSLMDAYKDINSIVGWAVMWFSGATDHLQDIKIPDNFSERALAEEFVEKCWSWRMACGEEAPTAENVKWAIQTAKDLLRAWDVQCGIESEKGGWE